MQIRLNSFRLSTHVALTAVLSFGLVAAWAQEAPNPDDEYLARFLERYPKVEAPPTLEAYATTAHFDERFLGEKLDKALEKASNNQGGLAWGLAYWMQSFNEMFRATGDAKYLEANRRCIEAALAVRDDKIGMQLWTGKIAPAWSSDKYAERGRAVFAVHTGMIVYPMLDWLLLVRSAPSVLDPTSEAYAEIHRQALESIAFHDRQWVDGPEPDSGHYIGMDQENVCEGKPLPGNRLSAMGRALWAAWKLTGNELYKERAEKMARYIKARLTTGPDGAYYWEYWLPEAPVTEVKAREDVKGEDSSHAQLTMSFPLLLAAEGVVFNDEDVRKFGLTVQNGIGRLGDGILLGSVTGDPKYKPDYVGSPDGWLGPARVMPEVRDRIVPFYLNYLPNPSAPDLAALVKMVNAKG